MVNRATQEEDAKRLRACNSCRMSKVKCELSGTRQDISCKRCAKNGLDCQFTPATMICRKKRKRLSRVVEYGKPPDDPTIFEGVQTGRCLSHFAPLSEQRCGSALDIGNSRQSDALLLSHGSPAPYHTSAHSHERQRLDGSVSPSHSCSNGSRAGKTIRNSDFEREHNMDVSQAITDNLNRAIYRLSHRQFVDRIHALIPLGKAPALLHRYNIEMAPHLPAVVFQARMAAKQLLMEKPMLYLSVLAVASYGTAGHENARIAAREVIGRIADCAIRNGVKSIESIQATQVIALWYEPPEQADQTTLYQIINIAATMAYDLGLDQRLYLSKTRRNVMEQAEIASPDTDLGVARVTFDEFEHRRALLGCYYLCASAAMMLRRPVRFEWTEYMEECIDVFMTSRDAAATDMLLCQHVKLQRICDKVGQHFRMHDSSNTITLDAAQVAHGIRHFEHALDQWRCDLPAHCQCPGLLFFEHVCGLYAHEVVLHLDHNAHHFRMPFSEESLESVNVGFGKLTQSQVSSFRACVKAAHGILEAMLVLDGTTISVSPKLVYFVGCVYAIVILIKMHVAVCILNSALSKVFHAKDLKVEYYLDSLIDHIGTIARQQPIQANKMIRILEALKNWFEEKHKKDIRAVWNDETHESSEHGEAISVTEDGYFGLRTPSQGASRERMQNNELLSPLGWYHGCKKNTKSGQIETYMEAVDTARYDRDRGTTFDAPSHRGSSTYLENVRNSSQSRGHGCDDFGIQATIDTVLDYMSSAYGGGLDNWLFGGYSTMPFVSCNTNTT